MARVRAPIVRRILFGGVRGLTEGMPEATGLGCVSEGGGRGGGGYAPSARMVIAWASWPSWLQDVSGGWCEG